MDYNTNAEIDDNSIVNKKIEKSHQRFLYWFGAPSYVQSQTSIWIFTINYLASPGGTGLQYPNNRTGFHASNILRTSILASYNTEDFNKRTNTIVVDNLCSCKHGFVTCSTLFL